MAEVAEKLSVATGKRIRYVNVAPEEAKRAQLAAGVPPYMADALAELFAERRKGKEAQVSAGHPDGFRVASDQLRRVCHAQCRDLSRRAAGAEGLMPRPMAWL